MRLTKLELYGFKSFARKTELDFGGGVTAVIGPNGSGKSNISDAIKWVLGEQSAKALRGSKMEDVIFSGTEARKAQAYSEVTLTFDNADGKLAVDFAEVAVTRRVYRSGESEYCINKTPCRLKDVQELFRDTGIGKDGYSIISQGKVDEILSNKSGDRRAALEEAAGVMRYRVRKEEAQRKLENTGKNLERIEDILRELTDRLGPLEAQSASARQYLKLRDEQKDHEVNLFLYQYERNAARLTDVKAAIAQLTEEQALSSGSEQALLQQCAGLEEQVRLLDASLAAQQTRLMAALSGVETHVGESNVLLERREHAKAEQARIAGEQAGNDGRREELQKALSAVGEDESRQAALALLDGDVAQAEAALSAMDEEAAASEQALEDMKERIIRDMNRASDCRSSISRLDAMQASIEERLAALHAEGDKQTNQGERLRRELAEAETLHKEKTEAHAAVEKELADSIAHRNALQAEYSALQEETGREEQTLSALQSRLRVLQEMAKSREGYYASVRSVMKDAERDKGLSQAIVGVVAELIRTPKAYETAITMALGSSLQNIITPTAEDAKYVIEYLRRNDYGRATLLPMALLSPGRIDGRERELLTMPGVLGVGSELVEYDGRIQTAVEYLLGRTVIVKDLDSGIALKKRARGAFHIATLEGDILSTGGSMSGGSLNKKGHSLLGREREIGELTQALSGKERAQANRKERLTGLARALTQSDVQVDAFRGELHVAEVELARQAEQLEIIRRDALSADERGDALAQEKARMGETLADIAGERAAAQAEQAGIEQGSAATRQDVLSAQTALYALRARRETAAATLTEMKVRRMALAKERDAVESERKRLFSELDKAEREREALDRAYRENETLYTQVDQEIQTMLKSISSEQKGAEEEKERQKKLEEERARLADSLSEFRARREELLRAGRDAAERLHRQELLESRLTMEQTAMQDHIWEEYELTYDNALALRHDIAVGAVNARIAEIKAALRELGDVNLSSIEDYKSVLERHTGLSAQCEDLKKAQGDLLTLIGELTDTMEKVFLRQFALIQTNFTEVFRELFGGGHAELRLADKSDVLGCDVDIIAQPPGKKLQLLSLLSGGERALTAIALLFAMLKLKPPAFCVLDEIESSLDEVNVSRFADYVKAYAEDTQFILITHRKGSMAVCDTLYGVAMEEKGISKIVSAKFEENAS